MLAHESPEPLVIEGTYYENEALQTDGVVSLGQVAVLAERLDDQWAVYVYPLTSRVGSGAEGEDLLGTILTDVEADNEEGTSSPDDVWLITDIWFANRGLDGRFGAAGLIHKSDNVMSLVLDVSAADDALDSFVNAGS